MIFKLLLSFIIPAQPSQGGEFRPSEDDDESQWEVKVVGVCTFFKGRLVRHRQPKRSHVAVPASQLDNQMCLISCLHCIIHGKSGK